MDASASGAGAVDGAVGAHQESASAAEQEADAPPAQESQAAEQFDVVKRLRLHLGSANIPHPEKVDAREISSMHREDSAIKVFNQEDAQQSGFNVNVPQAALIRCLVYNKHGLHSAKIAPHAVLKQRLLATRGWCLFNPIKFTGAGVPASRAVQC